MATGVNGPAEIVKDKYDRSVVLADKAAAEVSTFQKALNDSIYQPPQISVQWRTLGAINLPPIPDQPKIPGIDFELPDGMPSPFTGSMKDVQFSDFNTPAPLLDFGVAPTITIGQAPNLPEMRDVAMPDAPVVVLPDGPQMLDLQVHTFGGIDLHEDWLAKLDNIPELAILQPEPMRYTPGARYASQLLDSLKATLNARIHGGTGLSPIVEQQIWDRGRDRETQIALAREQEVMRAAEALGYPLPSGVMAGQLADARREYQDKLSGLSRDVSIKQADLEQQNLQNSIQAALQLEGQLMDQHYKWEMLVYESTKAAADNAIAVHNAALEQYKALLVGYQAFASAYETLIKAEQTKVEVFRALLQAEQAKADINKSLVDRYKAEIEARMAAVEIYKVQVQAAQTLVEVERTRIQAGGEQIKAFVATINAEQAKSELYKVQISAEGTKAEVYGRMVQAYSAKVGVQAERARAEVARYQGLISAKGLEWDGWKARLAAESTRIEAAARQSSVILDGYRAGAHAAEAQATSFARQWEAEVAQYNAVREITYRVEKANNDAIIHANDARMDAAKVMLVTGSQQVGSAWSMVSASAGISAGSSDTYVHQVD
ncbi:hypothetical protein [Comamonas sp. 4034]|uniref:hypothetical protein n=1 Tax=Comamonas sp. 4034 TaxID=3156455 RepID=UPI003D1B60AB